MHKKIFSSIVYLSLLISVPSIVMQTRLAQAEDNTIYKHTNEQGVVEFSDIPNKTNKPVHIPPMNTFKQQPLPRASNPKTTSQASKYTKLVITSPLKGIVIRENAGKVTVALNLDPALHASHTAKVVIDNDKNLTLTGTSLAYTFSSVSRGSHAVQAFILDAQGKVLIESAPVEFQLQRFTPLLKPPAPPPPAKPKSSS